jgi:DNA repair protein RadC
MTDVIRDLPHDDRPRERLLTHGAATLSDAELVGVVIGSGVPGLNAIQLARQLLTRGLRALQQREIAQLANIRGVGPAKAARIAAVFELSRRLMSERPEDPPTFDLSSLGAKLVADYAHHRQERLGAAFLDSRHRVQQHREIYVGTTDRALVSTRDIIRIAILDGASAVVVYHNHPSGDPTPSEDDISFTRKLQYSLSTMDVDLLDHLIIGAHRYHSMKERGQL